MDIYDIQYGCRIASYVFAVLFIVFGAAGIIGLIFGCKLLWLFIVFIVCGALSIICVLTEFFIDTF